MSFSSDNSLTFDQQVGKLREALQQGVASASWPDDTPPCMSIAAVPGCVQLLFTMRFAPGSGATYEQQAAAVDEYVRELQHELQRYLPGVEGVFTSVADGPQLADSSENVQDDPSGRAFCFTEPACLQAATAVQEEEPASPQQLLLHFSLPANGCEDLQIPVTGVSGRCHINCNPASAGTLRVVVTNGSHVVLDTELPKLDNKLWVDGSSMIDLMQRQLLIDPSRSHYSARLTFQAPSEASVLQVYVLHTSAPATHSPDSHIGTTGGPLHSHHTRLVCATQVLVLPCAAAADEFNHFVSSRVDEAVAERLRGVEPGFLGQNAKQLRLQAQLHFWDTEVQPFFSSIGQALHLLRPESADVAAQEPDAVAAFSLQTWGCARRLSRSSDSPGRLNASGSLSPYGAAGSTSLQNEVDLSSLSQVVEDTMVYCLVHPLPACLEALLATMSAYPLFEAVTAEHSGASDESSESSGGGGGGATYDSQASVRQEALPELSEGLTVATLSAVLKGFPDDSLENHYLDYKQRLFLHLDYVYQLVLFTSGLIGVCRFSGAVDVSLAFKLLCYIPSWFWPGYFLRHRERIVCVTWLFEAIAVLFLERWLNTVLVLIRSMASILMLGALHPVAQHVRFFISVPLTLVKLSAYGWLCARMGEPAWPLFAVAFLSSSIITFALDLYARKRFLMERGIRR